MPLFVLNVLKNGGIDGEKYPLFLEISHVESR